MTEESTSKSFGIDQEESTARTEAPASNQILPLLSEELETLITAFEIAVRHSTEVPTYSVSAARADLRAGIQRIETDRETYRTLYDQTSAMHQKCCRERAALELAVDPSWSTPERT